MRTWIGTLVLATAGCGAPSPAPTGVQDPCALAALATPGPLAQAIREAGSPTEVAALRVREARLTGDPGFYSLAEVALDCALAADPSSVEARRQQVHVDIQLHRFSDAAGSAERLVAQTGHWRDAMLLGDAYMEQGDLLGAASAYDRAMAQHPCLELYDRSAHLSWLTGDLQQALELQQLAVSAATPEDPEPMAWVLTRLGEYRIWAGETPNELGLALQVLEDYRPAHLALGRWWLHRDPARAIHHLEAAGATVAATVALAEVDPSADVTEVRLQDARGYAVWLSASDPDRALALLDAELLQRQDAATQMAWALAASRAGVDSTEQAELALTTGTQDPHLLWMGAQVLNRADLARQALAVEGGLLPSERRAAAEMLALKAKESSISTHSADG